MSVVARRLRELLRAPVPALGLLLVVFVALPVAVAVVTLGSWWQRVVLAVGLAAALLLGADVAFRLGWRAVFGRPYVAPPRLPFDEMYIEPHPYIPFVYKRHSISQRGGPAHYALHRGRFTVGQYGSNNLGFVNGPDGSRDIVVPKPTNLFRVACVGASTTGAYIEENCVTHSFPLELERLLGANLHRPVEVNNCAQGGYNSADVLVRFCLQVLDTEPDVVVVYLGYSDIRAYLTPGFRSDYSHARRNLGDTYWKYALSSRVPRPPLKVLTYLIDQWLPGNIRYSLLEQVSKGRPDPASDPSQGLRTYERNLSQIVQLCRANDVDVVLSTYCHFLYDEIANDPLEQLYDRIVERENDAVRRIAAEHDVTLVDNAVRIPREERYFLDSVHFTPDGMKLIASNLAESILPLSARR